MSRKTGTKWKTECCGMCGGKHSGYSGKLDKENIEYVVCNHRRLNVNSGMPWTKDEDIKKKKTTRKRLRKKMWRLK